MSLSAQGRDMIDLQAAGTAASQASPKSGRFVTNVNAIDWHLISPEGKHHYFHSLNFWAREHCELFGFDKTESNANKISSGIRQAKAGAEGKRYAKTCTYKGWTVIVE